MESIWIELQMLQKSVLKIPSIVAQPIVMDGVFCMKEKIDLFVQFVKLIIV